MFLNEGSAIFVRLAANSSLITELGGTAIYERHVPSGANKPYCVFFESAGRDLNETPRDERFIDVTVKGVSNSYAQAKRIASYVRASLHGADEALDPGAGWQCYRSEHTTDVEYIEKIDNKQEFNVGGIYRFRFNAT